MRPHFNSHLHNLNNQVQFNGANASAPQQVMRSQGNFRPNSMQVLPHFQVGMLNNPQLAMPPFTNPNPFLTPTQFFPFPQGSLQNPNPNNLPQLFANNAINPSQFLSGGQLNVPNLVQNVAQLLQMQVPNCGLPNPGFLNAQLGGANGNSVVQQSADGNGLMHINQNAALSKNFGSPQAQPNQNVFSPGGGTSQNNAGVVNGVNDRNNSWRKSHHKNFTGNHEHDASKRGFGKRQFPHRQNAQGKFKFNKENQGKGSKNIGVKNFTFSNSSEQIQAGKKRSILLNYTEQEIRQWREERRKNYPSNANMEKKQKENPTQPAVTDAAAKIRRQQLKEILAKQAELGCEVAEIPASYLSDSERQTDGRQQKTFGKKERFHNKFDKKGKFHQNDRFSKRQRSDSANSSDQKQRFTNNKREPSLLKKLLSSDVKRDKKHLLQIFRFMVKNSFFENWPEKSLKFPVVIVRESGGEGELVPNSVDNQMVCDDRSSLETDGLDEDEGERPQEVGQILG